MAGPGHVEMETAGYCQWLNYRRIHSAIGFPKVSIGSNARMDTELKALGMAQAFSGSADFTGLSSKAAMLGC